MYFAGRSLICLCLDRTSTGALVRGMPQSNVGFPQCALVRMSSRIAPRSRVRARRSSRSQTPIRDTFERASVPQWEFLSQPHRLGGASSLHLKLAVQLWRRARSPARVTRIHAGYRCPWHPHNSRDGASAGTSAPRQDGPVESREDLMSAYLAAWNQHEAERVAAFFAPD